MILGSSCRFVPRVKTAKVSTVKSPVLAVHAQLFLEPAELLQTNVVAAADHHYHWA